DRDEIERLAQMLTQRVGLGVGALHLGRSVPFGHLHGGAEGDVQGHGVVGPRGGRWQRLKHDDRMVESLLKRHRLPPWACERRRMWGRHRRDRHGTHVSYLVGPGKLDVRAQTPLSLLLWAFPQSAHPLSLAAELSLRPAAGPACKGAPSALSTA